MKTNPRAQLLRILSEVGRRRTSLRKRWDVTVSARLASGKHGVRPHRDLPESSVEHWAEALEHLGEIQGLITQARELAQREMKAHRDGTCGDCND